MEVVSHPLAEATRSAPFIYYAVCIDDYNRPANHKGNWPIKDRIYAVRVVESRTEGIPLIHVLTFRSEVPYFNAFACPTPLRNFRAAVVELPR